MSECTLVATNIIDYIRGALAQVPFLCPELAETKSEPELFFRLAMNMLYHSYEKQFEYFKNIANGSYTSKTNVL